MCIADQGYTIFINKMFRRLKAGSIEPHPSEKAIILNYKLEATVFGDPGDPMLEESKVRVIDFSTIKIFAFSTSCSFFRVTVVIRHWPPVNFQYIFNERLLFTELSTNHTTKISKFEN